ncbi:hypothetical protein PR048_000316 [Dryococelus australis]|uniref:HTH CENPB-type domain-containing protein n=1 Tax=Dryococelus australis TaxID=614101 RepID=A0ABQ9IEB4_9NEOP|nr:hypothetical protein PR048_000316 [Dryococelus australis]
MEATIRDIHRGLSIKRAAEQNSVPRITLPRTPLGRKMGPSSWLRKEEMIVKWVITMSKAGFPVTKEDLMSSVQQLVKELNRGIPFKDGRPGRKRCKAFLKRNPNLSLRTPQNLTSSRADVSSERLMAWYWRYLKDSKSRETEHNTNSGTPPIQDHELTEYETCPSAEDVEMPGSVTPEHDMQASTSPVTFTSTCYSGRSRTTMTRETFPQNDTSSEDDPPLLDSSDEWTEHSGDEELDMQKLGDSTIRPGSFALVKFLGGKRAATKSVDKSKKIFTPKDDVSYINIPKWKVFYLHHKWCHMEPG